jgi:hypothetical protein
MPKRSRTGKRDVNQMATNLFDVISRKPSEDKPDQTKDPLAVELGRRGGLKGGVARAQKLSPRRRRQIARKAAQRRWETRPH